MRVFKPQFRDRITGQSRETQKWYLDFRDHRQIRRRIPAERCRTEKQAERFGEMVEALVMNRQYGQSPDRRVVDWLHGLPKGTLGKFAEIDLIDEQYVTASTTLEQHIADFEKWLRGTRAKHGFARNPVYIHNVLMEVRYIIRECGCTYWSDLTKAAVESCLGKLSVASKTYNGYLASVKLFATWMAENGRAVISPVAGIKPVRWQKTESRRAMIPEEVGKLLVTTAAGPVRYGMAGVDRAVLYLLAIDTGFRSGELRELTVGCFDLDNATVTLGAEFCKNRQEAVQYLKRSRAEQLRAYLADREPGEKVFNMPLGVKVVTMLRRDLIAAGIKPIDERGTRVVFHSLRYTLSTSLDRTGASLKERMTILRHSDKGSLTLGTYTTLQVIDLRGAVERLPDYPWPADAGIPAENREQARREVA
jgi:integrase